MTDTEACCTCASLLNPPTYSSLNVSLETEKPFATPSETTTCSSPPRRLPCCSRAICASCLSSNPRFQTYCPFCQVSTEPSPLPQGLRDPPAYSSSPGSPKQRAVDVKEDVLEDELPPPYMANSHDQTGNRNGVKTNGGAESEGEDVIHYLHPSDTIPSLSLAYHIPAPILRQHNSLFSDNLLLARKTLQIPRSHYSGPSLSADPVEDPEETERKSRIRKFMVGVKCHDYSMAELYLKQAGGEVERALEAWRDDERWERENPLEKQKAKGKEKGRRIGSGGGLVGQLR